MNPTQPRTLCGRSPEGLNVVQALLDATCVICVANIRPEHLVHLEVGDWQGVAVCGDARPGSLVNSPHSVNCKACLEALQAAPKPTFHIADVISVDSRTRTMCGEEVQSGVVAVPPKEADCQPCLDAYRRVAVHIVDQAPTFTEYTLCGLFITPQIIKGTPEQADCELCLGQRHKNMGISSTEVRETLVSATNPFDIVNITLDGAKVTFQRDSMVSITDFLTPEGALEHHANVTGWLRAQGWKDVVRASVHEPQAGQAAVSAFGDPISLLREWYAHWNEDGEAPTKLPNSLHTRTAGFLAVCDKG